MIASLRRLLALVAKEFAAILRDPKSRFVVIGPPIIQFFMFGYAATFDVSDVPYALVDESRTVESRDLAARFDGSGAFRLAYATADAAEAERLLLDERVRLIVRIPADFAEDLLAARPAPVQVIADGRNSNVAGIAAGYAAEIAAAFDAERFPDAGTPVLVERAWHNPNFSSRWYVVSCLGGVIATVVVTLLTSLSVAREREFGTFDQLLVTPLTPAGILIGKAIPPAVFGMFNASLLSTAAVLWYGVPFTGSVAAAAAVLMLYILAVTGVGLFISSLCTTMQQGLLGSFVFIMPATVLSGFTTPIENMPDWLHAATAANPLRWAVWSLRRVFLEAGTLADVAPALGPLALIATLTLTAAAWLFRRRAV